MQGQLGIADAFPGAGLGHDARVLRAVVIGHSKGAVRVDGHMAAQPEIGQVVELHTVFGTDGSGGFFRGSLGLRMAYRVGVGLGHFTDPRVVRHGYGNILAVFGVQGDGGIGNLLPGAGHGNDAVAVPAVVESDRESIVFLQINVAAQPAVCQVVKLHAAGGSRFRSLRWGGFLDGISQIGIHPHGGAVGLGVQDVVASLPHSSLRGVAGSVQRRAHEAEHHIVAGADRQVGVHPVDVRHGGVGHHHAGEAPFAPQHVGDQRAGGTGPGRAQIAVTGHDGRGFAFLHRDFKGAEIHLAHGLLVGPDGEMQAVFVLIVEDEVLGVEIDALRRRSPHLGSTQLAGKQAVLGIILEVAAGEGSAVDVHAGSVQARDAVGLGFLGEHAAERFHQLRIPGGADHHLAGEGNAPEGADEGIEARGAVDIGGGGLADAPDGGGGPAALEDHFGHVLHAELLQEQIPLRIVPGEARHVAERQAVNRKHDFRIVFVDRVRCFIGEGFYHGFRRFLARHTGLGQRARPVGTGNIGFDLAVFHVGEPGHGGGLVGGTGVLRVIYHGVFDNVFPAVDHVVGVAHQLDFVCARFQHIAAVSFAVEGSHFLGREGDGQCFAFAGPEQPGLGKAGQHHMGFLDAAGGVGRGVVHLDHVLAIRAAGICDLDLHRDDAILHGKRFDALLEVRIAQAIAEGILHRGGIVDGSVGGGGLIIAVPHINALGVLHIAAPFQVAVREIAGVPIRGGGREVIGIGVRQPSGGVHFTGEHPAHGIEAHRAGAADPQAGIHVFRETQLHGIGGIDQDDHLRVALTLHQRQQVLFILRQLQVVAAVVLGGIARGVHVHGQVAALAADAGNHDHRRIRKRPGIGKEAFGIAGSRHLRRGEIRAGETALLDPADPGIAIEIRQLFIDLQPSILQAGDHVHVAGGIARAGTGAAVDRVHGSVAEEIDLRSGGQGQRAVFIAQQHDAFAFQLFRHLQALRRGVVRAENLMARCFLRVCGRKCVHGSADCQRGDQQYGNGNA